MDGVLNFFDDLFSGRPEVILSFVIFGAVALAVLGLFFVLTQSAARRRLSGRVRATSGGAGAPAVTLRHTERGQLTNRLIQPFEKYIAPQDENQRSTIRRKLIQAGYLGGSAVTRFYALRAVLALLLPGAFLAALPFASREISVQTIVLIGLGLGLFGLYAPRLWVTNRIQRRQTLAREGFPDALDLLLVCVEAGLGLNAALQRVAQELGSAHPMLTNQFRLVGLELQAGKTREEALRNLAERIGIEEVRSLSTLLIQSERFGTSIGQALRVHAAEMRAKRMLRAEEKAHMLPVKMAFPLVCFILPCLVIVIMTPAIIRISRTLLPTLGGG